MKSVYRTDLAATKGDGEIVARLLAAAKSAGPATLDIASLRAGLDRMLSLPLVLQGNSAVSATPGDIGGVPGEWFDPPDRKHDAVLIFFHGGGYVRGNLALGRPTTSVLAAQSGSRVFAAAYRQGPEHPFPAAYDDALAIALALGKGTTPYALIGESAGGGLAIAAAMGMRDIAAPLPFAVAGISAFLDLTLTAESWQTTAGKDLATRELGLAMSALYLGDADASDPRASPVFGKVGGLPPLHLTIGSVEGLFDETLDFAEKAASAGVEVALDVYWGMPHGYSKFTLAATALTHDRLSRWLVGHLNAKDLSS